MKLKLFKDKQPSDRQVIKELRANFRAHADCVRHYSKEGFVESIRRRHALMKMMVDRGEVPMSDVYESLEWLQQKQQSTQGSESDMYGTLANDLRKRFAL